MEKSKLFSLLKSLSNEEFQNFSRFIRSSYFTTSKDVVRLYDYIRKYYPVMDSPKLEKEIVFKKLFPNTSYSDGKLRNLMRKLTRVLEDYLILLEGRKSNYERRKSLIKIYGERNVIDQFEKESFRLLEDLHALPFRDAQYFSDRFDLLYQVYFHPGMRKKKDRGIILVDALEQLQNYFSLEQLMISCEIKNRTSLYKEEYTISQLQEQSLSGNFLQELFSNLSQLFLKNEDVTYFKIKEMFLDHFEDMRSRDIRFVFYSILNYAIGKVTHQESFWLSELFDWYKLGVEKSLLIFNNQLSDNTFLNIVTAGAKIKEFDWVNQFILKYEKYLNPKSREEVVIVAFGFFHFNKGDYDKVLELLLIDNFAGVLLQINVKTLLIRTYYEKFISDRSYYSLLVDRCNAFDMYIRRNKKIGMKRIKAYLNFVQMLKRIAKIKTNPSSSQKDNELKKRLPLMENIALKSWLIEKAENIAI